MAKHFLLIEELIIKYARRRRLTKREQHILQQWRDRSDYHRALPELFRDHEWLRHNLQRMDEVPADRMWEYVRDRIAATLAEEPVTGSRSWKLLLQWGGGVAAFIGLLGTGYYLLHRSTPMHKTDTITYANVKTDPTTIRLPDSSFVQLSYASSLSVNFNGKAREVTVTGQAFFDIAKNPNRPFLVHTKKATVEVLGTSFNIKGYADEAGSTITLKDGLVSVHQDGQQIRLRPSQQVVVRDKEPMKIKTVDVKDVLAWAEKDPLFRFVDADLATVLQELARYYKLTIQYSDNVDVTGMRFTGDLKQKDSLDYNLLLINRVVRGNARLLRKDQRIIISPGLVSR